MIYNQEFLEVSKEMQLEIIGNKLFTNVTINDSVYKLVFDTGASNTVITDTTIFKEYHKEVKSNFGKTTLINKKVSLGKIAMTSRNEMYASQNEMTTIIFSEMDICKPEVEKGLLGTKYFTSDDKKILNLDFESVKAKVLSEVDKEVLLTEYQEIKSEFILSGRHFNIFLKVNGVEEPFLFDTGNSAAPLVIGSKSKSLLKNGIEYHGSVVYGADGAKSNDINIYYNHVNVEIGDIKATSLVFFNSAYIAEQNNVGLSFIKNFNWIIDYKKKKVYYKQIKDDFTKEFTKTFKYLVNHSNGNLYVWIKLGSATAYNIGDQITAVNNISVTSESLCELRNLINNTSDWSTLNLTVIPRQQKK